MANRVPSVRGDNTISPLVRADWTEQLLGIATLDETEEAIDRVFEVGCELLDLPIAILGRLNGDVVQLRGNDALGEGPRELPIGDDFVAALMSKQVRFLRDLGAVGARGPVIRAFELKAMASVAVHVDHQPWGLLTFAHREVRTNRFPRNTEPLLDALGATLSHMLERDVARSKLVPIERLQRSNRELEEYAYAAAHDLRSPLRAMRSFAELLAGEAQKGEPDIERILAHATRIMEGGDRMDRLLLSMLDHATVVDDKSDDQPFSLADSVQGAIAVLESEIARTGTDVRVGPLPVVIGDVDQWQRVFANLLENAMKYRHPDRKPSVHLWSVVGEQHVEIHVRDNGLGIPVEHADRVFGLFKRLTDDDEGTGVGLSVVRRIIEDEGGSIAVEQPPDHGVDLVIRLPLDRFERDDESMDDSNHGRGPEAIC